MKCDELKPIELECNMGKDINGVEHREPWKAYDIDEVDAAIAELKDKCQMHDFFWEGCGFAKRGFKNTIAVSEAFDKLEAENAELKKKLMPCLNGDCILTCEVVEKYGKENAELKQKLEDVQASAYAESVDAGMRERRLRRALWLARAERAKERKYKYETWERNELKKFNCDEVLIAIVSMKARKWRRVEIKCIKKAEEYK